MRAGRARRRSSATTREGAELARDVLRAAARVASALRRLRRRAAPATTCGSASSSTSAPLVAPRGLALPDARPRPYAVDVTRASPSPTASPRAGATPTPAIAAHLELAREMLGAGARAARATAPPAPLVRGDELARELGHRARARSSGELLAQLEEDRFAGEIATREDAISARAGAAAPAEPSATRRLRADRARRAPPCRSRRCAAMSRWRVVVGGHLYSSTEPSTAVG